LYIIQYGLKNCTSCRKIFFMFLSTEGSEMGQTQTFAKSLKVGDECTIFWDETQCSLVQIYVVEVHATSIYWVEVDRHNKHVSIMLVNLCQTIWHYIPPDSILHNQNHENFKPHNLSPVSALVKIGSCSKLCIMRNRNSYRI
jgi:hypothetical protein